MLGTEQTWFSYTQFGQGRVTESAEDSHPAHKDGQKARRDLSAHDFGGSHPST